MSYPEPDNAQTGQTPARRRYRLAGCLQPVEPSVNRTGRRQFEVRVSESPNTNTKKPAGERKPAIRSISPQLALCEAASSAGTAAVSSIIERRYEMFSLSTLSQGLW